MPTDPPQENRAANAQDNAILAKAVGAAILSAVAGGGLVALILQVGSDVWRAAAWSALGFGVLGAVICLAYFRLISPLPTPTLPDYSTAARTNRTVGFTLLTAFVFALVGAYIPALAHKEAKDWYELYQSGFLFLAGALTTVIGYYFGNRGVQQVQETANKAITAATQGSDEARRSIEELGKRAKTEAAEIAKPVTGLEDFEVPTS